MNELTHLRQINAKLNAQLRTARGQIAALQARNRLLEEELVQAHGGQQLPRYLARYEAIPRYEILHEGDPDLLEELTHA